MGGRFETYIRERARLCRGTTHDGLTMVIVGWPYAEFAANKEDIEGNYLKTIAMAQDFADRLRGARRMTRFRRRGGAELFPQALWSGLGAGGRCGLQPGFHYRTGNSRCLP